MYKTTFGLGYKDISLASEVSGSHEEITSYYKSELNYFLQSLNDKEYIVGIDQSTTCTGIGILSTDEEVQCILEIPSMKRIEDEYIRLITSVLYSVIDNLNVKVIVTEDTLKGSFTSTVSILSKFLANLKASFNWHPFISSIKQDTIPNNTWKSNVIDKSKGKGRFRKKTSVYEDLVDLYPNLKPFDTYTYSHGKSGYDGFEGLGIALGYKRHVFTEDGKRKATKVNISSSSIRCYSFFIPVLKENDDNREIVFGNLVPKMLRYTNTEVVYQPQLSVVENAVNMSSIGDRVFAEITNRMTILGLCWENDLEFSDDYKYYLFVARRKATVAGEIIEYYTNNSFKSMKNKFPYIHIDNISTLKNIDSKMLTSVDMYDELYNKY